MGKGSSNLDKSIYPTYLGKLSGSPDPLVRRLYYVYAGQLQRCYNPKCARWPSYGGVGISVEYTVRDFVSWYLVEKNNFTGTDPSVGRIDHSKNYRFDNIRIESVRDNSRELSNRIKFGELSFKRPVLVLDHESGEPLMIAETIREASKWTDVKNQNITNICRTAQGLPGYRSFYGKGFTFRYLDID